MTLNVVHSFQIPYDVETWQKNIHSSNDSSQTIREILWMIKFLTWIGKSNIILLERV